MSGARGTRNTNHCDSDEGLDFIAQSIVKQSTDIWRVSVIYKVQIDSRTLRISSEPVKALAIVKSMRRQRNRS